MKIERVIEILEKHQEWRRDKNFPSTIEMQSPIEVGTAIDYALIELKKIKSIKVPECMDEMANNYCDSCGDFIGNGCDNSDCKNFKTE